MGDLSLRMLCHSTHRQAESGDGSRKVHLDLRANELADDSINLFQKRLVVDWRLGSDLYQTRVWHEGSSPARGPDLVDRYQHRSAFLLNQKHYEFRRFGLARVSPDDVNIRGTFIKGLTGRQRHFFSAPHLHHD